MHPVMIVAEIVAPVFILAGVGYIWVRMGMEYRVQFVSKLAMKLALPCLMFQALTKTALDPALLWTIAAAALAAHVALVPVFYALVRATGIDIRTYLSPLIFGNTGNLGMPLAFFAFGQAGLDVAVIVFAVSLVMSFTLGIWFVTGESSLGSLFREPAVYAVPLALLLKAVGFSMPVWANNTLDLIGQVAIPLMLLTLGVAISRLRPQRAGLVLWLSALKLGICFGLAWVVATLFALPDVAFAVLVVQMCTPVAVTAYLIAENYGAKSDEVAGFVVVSTLISVIALPAILSLFVGELIAIP